jgi:hypothetical protein
MRESEKKVRASLLAKTKKMNLSNFKHMCVLLGAAFVLLLPVGPEGELSHFGMGPVYAVLGIVALLGGAIYLAMLLWGLVLQAKFSQRRY